MDLGEFLSYLRHHLAPVGRTDPLFAEDAVAGLHRIATASPVSSTMPPPPPRWSAADGKPLVDDASANKAAT
jgi:hypothetical protein